MDNKYIPGHEIPLENHPAIALIVFNMPPFMTNEAALWFSLLEHDLQAAEIITEEKKFNHICCNFDL